jgi:hypothetical protein
MTEGTEEAVRTEVAIKPEILEEILHHPRDLEVQTTLRVRIGKPAVYGLIIGRGQNGGFKKFYWEDPQFNSQEEAIERIRVILEAALDTAGLSPNFSGGLNQEIVDRIVAKLTIGQHVHTYHPSFYEEAS